MTNFTNLKTTSTRCGNKMIVTTFDADSNKVLRKVEYIDKDGDKKFTYDEINKVSLFTYRDGLREELMVEDSDFDGYYDYYQSLKAHQDVDGEYTEIQSIRSYSASLSSRDQRRRGWPTMTERAKNDSEIELFQNYRRLL